MQLNSHEWQSQAIHWGGFPFSSLSRVLSPSSFASCPCPHYTALFMSNVVSTFGAVTNASVVNRTFKRAKNCFSSLRGWLWRGAAAQLFCTLASRQRVWLHKAGLQLGKTDLLPLSVPQTAPATHSSVLALALRPLQNPSEVNPGNQTLRKLHGAERINFLVSERSELTRRKACRVP